MKRFSLLFLSLFIIGLISTSALFGDDYHSTAPGGDWSLTTTWVEGIVPTTGNNAIIVTGSTVTVSAAQTCDLLTINAGGQCTISGAFTLPGTSQSLDPASTVEYTAVPSAFVYATYGNLIYDGANFSLANNLTVLGNLTITTATLRGIGTTSGSWTHTISGNVIVGPGTSARISAVNQSAATTASCTWNIAGNLTLSGNNAGNRIILYESGGPHTGNAIFNIDGNLSIGGGSQIQFKSSSSTSVDYPTGTINLKGSFDHSGIIGIPSGTGLTHGLVINMVGTSNQNWSGSTGTFSISAGTCTVNINNPAGVTLTAPRTFTTNSILNLINGKLNTDATNLLTITTGTITGGSSSSFINGPLAGRTLTTYPIGAGSAYRPVLLGAVTGTSPVISAMVTNGDPGGTADGSTLSSISKTRYWTIGLVSGTFTSGTVNLTYDADDGVSDNGNLNIGWQTSAGSNGTYASLGGSGSANTSGNITSNSISSLGSLAAPSFFVLANNLSGTNALPVELSSFTSNVKGRDINLRWETKTEVNSNKFVIERASVDNRNWAIVGIIQASGTVNSPKKYSYSEKNLQSGKYQYRLKMIDNDGSYKYSNTVETEITLPRNFALSQNYPNPFNPSTKIDYQVPVDSKVILEVYNIAGQKVIELVNKEQSAGYYTVDFGSSKLSSGIYIYRIVARDKATGNNFSSIKKMMLLK